MLNVKRLYTYGNFIATQNPIPCSHNYQIFLKGPSSPYLLIVVHGLWGTWSGWSECSVTCGEGMRSRNRKCDSPAPLGDGDQCNGEETEVVICTAGTCTSRNYLFDFPRQFSLNNSCLSRDIHLWNKSLRSCISIICFVHV